MNETTVFKYLDDDETLCWVGKPNTERFFTVLDAAYILFGICCVLCSTWVMFHLNKSTVSVAVVAVLFVVMGILFVFGMYCALTRIIVKALGQNRTLYALSDKNVYFFRASRLTKVSLNDVEKANIINKSTVSVRRKCKQPYAFVAFLQRGLMPYAVCEFSGIKDASNVCSLCNAWRKTYAEKQKDN